MNNDFNRGLITGLAMQPFYVAEVVKNYEGGDVICSEMVSAVHEQTIVDDIICSPLSVN